MASITLSLLTSPTTLNSLGSTEATSAGTHKSRPWMGVNRCFGPFKTDAEAAVYHDVVATRFHVFPTELNYPDEAVRTSRGHSTGGFDGSGCGVVTLVHNEPNLRRSFQFGVEGITSPKSWPPKGRVTSLLTKGETGPVVEGDLVTLDATDRTYADFHL